VIWFLIRDGKPLTNERIMNSDIPEPRSLREIEMEVLAEGREWMRQRLEQKLQAEANRHGGVFPPQRSQSVAPAKPADAPAHRRRGD
jgi:hypothetical protein